MNISDQDTIGILQDSVMQKPDSVIRKGKLHTDSIKTADTLFVRKKIIRPEREEMQVVDTVSVCQRNNILDITYYDSTNVILTEKLTYTNRFPFVFTEKNAQRKQEERILLVSKLRDCKDLSAGAFHEDWIIIMVLFVAFIYSFISLASKKMLPEMMRFIFFRGIGESAARDTAAMFHWQSTLLNFISFLNIAIFSYVAASINNAVPTTIHGFVFWLIISGFIALAVTLRHIITIIVGAASEQRDVFNEYLICIYQSYRVGGFVFFMLVVLVLYTVIIPVNVLIITGISFTGMMYLVRVLHLFLIFIRRNISIFYFILYLCALEILPVVIAIKFFTGLF